MITYRNLKKEEAQAFWGMMNALDNETKFMMFEPGEREKKAKNIRQIEAMIESAAAGEDFLLAAVCEDEIAGYLSAQRGNLNRILHVAYIVTGIREKYRGKGIGTKFFEELDKWAKEKKITRLELTVLCQNLAAKRLYEKSGFAIEGTKKNSMLLDGVYADEYYMAKLYPEN